MLKIVKYLKPFAWAIIVIFLLLFAQAMADLSLPGYMSNIVNIGIQAGGIENAVPQAVRASEFNKLTLFMDENEKAQVTGDYILLDKAALSDTDYTGYVKTYPELANGPVYKLNTNVKEEIARLDIIFRPAVIFVSTIEKSGLSGFSSNATIQIPAGVDPFTILAQLPTAQLETIRTMAASQIKAIPDTLLRQYATPYISAEYKALGMNVSQIQTNYVLRIGLLMLLLTLAGTIASVIVGYLSARIAAGLGKDLRRRLFVRVADFSSTEFDKFSTASLITRSTNDITQIQMVMVMMFRFLFYAPIIGVGGVLKVLDADKTMLWIIAGAVCAMLMLMAVVFTIAMPKFKALQKLVDRINLIMREMLTGLMVIRAFNTQKHEEKKFDVANTDLMKTSLFINRVIVFMMPMMMLLMNGVMLLIVWVGAHQVDLGTTQVGDLMAFMQYAMMIIMSFMMVTVMFIMLPRASVSAERIREVLDTEPVIEDKKTLQKFNLGLKGVVEFKDVSFRYPAAEDDVLNNITFTAKPGQTTAIIGSTGSGKSTLINLIPRFYDVTGGNIYVDGVDVRDVKQRDLREKIGYVSQNAVLFSGTIGSNIKYANELLSNDQVAQCAQTAQALDFITSSDKGYDMPVSQGGTNLSGGQKQRLAIARALAKRPEIYIFDDALSALDFKTDAALRRALKQETSDATVLIVTQRVGTIMGAEQIVVLDDGKVAGIGTHMELMKNCNVYREIALSQLSREEMAS
jgi:ATP-binding cassette, subfamily B, multidrug efflux pump